MRDLRAEPHGNHVRLTWVAPTNTAIHGYTAAYTSSTTVGDNANLVGGSDPATTWKSLADDAAPYSTVTGLDPDTTYRFRVLTFNLGQTRIRNTPVAVVRATPRVVRLTAGPGRLTANWTPSNSNATTFDVQYRNFRYHNGAWQVGWTHAGTNITGTSLTIPNLTDGNIYDVRARGLPAPTGTTGKPGPWRAPRRPARPWP